MQRTAVKKELQELLSLPDDDTLIALYGTLKLPGEDRPENLVIKGITGQQHQTLLGICKTGTVLETKIALKAYINMLEDLHEKL